MTDDEDRRAAGNQTGDGLGAAESWGWTRGHRIGLGLLMAVFLGLLIVQFVRRPARGDDPLVVINGHGTSLPRRVDPNRASAAELSRIPHIGPKMAAAIVGYREARKGGAAGGIVFARREDLDRVPGVGKKLIEQIGPYLDFPEIEEESGGGDAEGLTPPARP